MAITVTTVSNTSMGYTIFTALTSTIFHL